MPDFNPIFSPKEMLALGVFDGGYFNEDDSSIRQDGDLPKIRKTNLFAANVSQPKQVWLDNGWITPEDPLGWFQWYTRYHNGRRLDDLDSFQIKRWSSFVARHSAQVKKNGLSNLKTRIRQRQCLLHWAADPIPDMQIENKFEFLLSHFKING